MKKLFIILLCLSCVMLGGCTNDTDVSKKDNNIFIEGTDKEDVDNINVEIIDVSVKPISGTTDFVNVEVTIKNNTDKNIRFISVDLYFYDKDRNIIFSDYTNSIAVIKPGANQKLERMIESDDWVSVEAEVNKITFEELDEMDENTHNETYEKEGYKEIDAIEIISSIIPYGNFEIDREEVRDGVEYCVIRCTDPDTNNTIGWYYLRKEDEKLFEWNLANNTLIEVIQNTTTHLSKPYEKLLGHWIADNGVEYWYGEEYLYSDSITGMESDSITYISDRDEIINYFAAFKDAKYIENQYDNRGLTVYDYFMNDDIIDNCVIEMIYDEESNFMYQGINVLSEDGNSSISYSRLDVELFIKSGSMKRVSSETSPN